jgi:peptidoglycan hydrolase-like protein with peptidoglycan-binding domain
MKAAPLRFVTRAALSLAAAAALAGCASLDSNVYVAAKANEVKTGPKSAPYKSITGFASGLRCMDNLLLEHGARDVSVIVEDLADQTKKVNAGTKDMLISAVSDMTRRSRAIRLVAYGQDSGNTIGFLQQALRRDHFAVVPQFALRGSISQFDDAIVRRNADVGVSLQPVVGLGVASTSQASVLGIDLTLLATQDLTVVPGVASRNSVILFKQGKGYDGEAQIRKFGVNFELSTATQEGQTQALRALVELAAIELFGRLGKVPYWTCLGASDKDEAVATEMRDWYDAMLANPSELVEYFQVQMRARRVYDGPLDGVVNPQIKEAVARYREALGLSREPKLSFDLFKAYLTANHSEIAPRVEPVLAATTPLAPAPAAAQSAAAAAPAPAPRGPLALQISAQNNARKFSGGEVVRLNIKPSRDAHVYCFLQDEKQQISRFFPNRFRRDSHIAASQGLQLPGAMRFEIRMNPRGVQETVSCFATERDVMADLPAALSASDFEPLPVGSLEVVRDVFINVSGGTLAQEYFHVQSK